ncbi:MAG: hypothetical protein HQK61_03800 [Desulfamplus sp.]|nr:hypothetical protein [Desulfamplus sp.]
MYRLIPISVFACFLWLALKPDLSLAIPELTGLSAFIVILLAIAQTDFAKRKQQFPCNDQALHSTTPQPWSAGFILVFALVLRVMFLWHPPALSDDIYRYCLDGIMLINGHNPYGHAPLDVYNSFHATDFLVPLANNPDLPAIYPPAAQIVFAAGAFAGKITGMVTGMKLVLVMMDILSCALIIGILKEMKLPVSRATIYAWHPLPVLEVSSSGHIDAAAIFFLLMAVYVSLHHEIKRGYWWNGGYWRNRSYWWSVLALSGIIPGIFMGLSILTRWMPLMFLPGLLFMLRCTRRKIAATGGCAVLMGLLTTLFWPDIVNSISTLNIYIQKWEFSGFVFRIVEQKIEGHIARPGAGAPVLIAVVFLYLACSIFLRILKNHSLQATMTSFFMVSLAWLILTPTLYPWHSLYLVAFLPFSLNIAGLALSWSVLLAYQVLIPYKITGQWTATNTVPLMIAGAPAAAFAGYVMFRYPRKTPVQE